MRKNPFSLRRHELGSIPALLGDLWRYARYRRSIYYHLSQRRGGILPIESVSLPEGLKRVHRYRFPGEPFPAEQTFDLTLTEDFESLEHYYLAALCRVIRPRRIFEIGTYEGRTANLMALHGGADCEVFTLDLPVEGAIDTALRIEDADRKWLMKEDTSIASRIGSLADDAVNRRITSLLGDSAKFDYAPWRRRIDLTFVDGAHSYEYVMSDVKNALRMMTRRGIVLMHDFLTHDEVTLAATHLRQRYEVIHVSTTSFAILFPRGNSGV